MSNSTINLLVKLSFILAMLLTGAYGANEFIKTANLWSERVTNAAIEASKGR
jgi:hypothetical protein